MTAALNENNDFNFTQPLIMSLNEFGLNPLEWNLAPESCQEHVLLVHKNDPEFCLKGEVSNYKWKSLTVVSL